MIATVDGVLEHNKQIRDNMLKYNIGKYSQWPFALKPAIGEYYDIDYNRQLSDLKDGKDLLSFTHDGKSTYSEEIKRKFFSSKEEEPYFVRPLTYGELNPWFEFQNGSYIQYIDDVFGKDDVMRHVDYINNLLSGQFIENALRQTEVGVIRDINVAVALQGIVTTNPNNMSGEETVMGKISNRMYAQTLYNGAIFNSDRMKAKIHDGENYYQKAYLTPSLVNQYGNNLANLYKLSDIMKVGTNETHIREDLGADVHILDGYTENNFANLNLPQFRLLNEQIKKAIELKGVDNKTLTSKVVTDINGNTSFRDNKGNELLLPISIYTPVDGKGYVNTSKKNNDWRYETLGFADVDGDGLESQSTTGGRLYGVYSMNVYNEVEDGKAIPGTDKLNDEGNQHNIYDVIDDDSTSLLSKTSRLFHQNKIDTLIARFHTDSTKYGIPEFTDTARSEFGNSHGRNLLRLDAKGNPANDTNGYDNPYCRTWTYHHQYNQVKKLIRPFTHVVDGEEQAYTNREIQSMNKKYRAYRNDDGQDAIFGYQSLADNTVLQPNGFVKITPKSGDEGMDVRKCMFSIENLAWKDVLPFDDNLSKEQRGPNGGRIMWFPPYDLDFQEGVNVEWSQNTFIGRGEKVYTYTNTERTGTLSFSLLIDHPAIINSVAKNAYEGIGKEKDPEADILRFFAGCELLPEPDKLIPPGDIPEKQPHSEQQEGKIVFKIYYPNNFTGIVSDRQDCKGEIAYNQFNDYVLSGTSGSTSGGTGFNSLLNEDYWWQYILVGNNTCIPTNKDDFRGYEMMEPSTSGNGLTNETDYTNIPLPTCKDNKCVVHPKPLKINENEFRNTCSEGLSDDENEMYYYQVDEDLHQKLNDKGSYKDTTSFQLNASFITTDEVAPHQDYEYTFAEVIMALLLYNKGKGKYGSLYDTYKGYVVDKLKVDGGRIRSLVDLFSNTRIKFTNVSYSGSADNNDKTNANMLAHRRAFTGFGMLKRLFTKLKDSELNEIAKQGTATTGGKTNVPAYGKGQKVCRFCEFTINYLIPAEELKDTIDDDASEQNEEEEQVTFEMYLEAIRIFSEVINVYYMSLHNYDDGALDKKLKEHFKTLKGIKQEDLNNVEFKKKEVKALLETCVNKDALILAYAISDGNTNENFRNEYKSETNRYDMLKKQDGVTPLLDPDNRLSDNFYLRYMVCYFAAIGAKLPNFELSTGFEYVFPLKDYEGAETKTYHFQTYKFISHLLFVHYLKDNFHLFDISTERAIDDEEEALTLLISLVGKYEKIFNAVYELINYRAVYYDNPHLIRKKYYDIDWEIYLKNNNLINELNNELFAIAEAEDAEALLAQQIQEQRPETEENKAEQQEEVSEIVMVYGRDEDIPNIRYESEGDYFKNIEITDPLLFRNLKDKFKYFNPAYHSISPEGFNARLTFLQQCTRQGQTVEIGGGESPNSNGKTASNLAFGRMPVCVIRIGDFINTRAIINSMTISYAAANGVVWDLNSEGVGVQPMYAKISLTITLLGGQSLGAPISRLQNAISFNYYANAEAYDNRADVATYEKNDDGDLYVSYKRLWTPINDKNYIPKNDKAALVSEKNKNTNIASGSFKQPTDEQIADKLNPETSGSASGGTADDNMIEFSQELTDYVRSFTPVQNVLNQFGVTDPFTITMMCNKDCSEYEQLFTGYEGLHGIKELQVISFYEYLKDAIKDAVDMYRRVH